MTDTLIEKPEQSPTRVRRFSVGTNTLPVDCPRCGHPVHFHACDVRRAWWKRLVGRQFCCCLHRPRGMH